MLLEDTLVLRDTGALAGLFEEWAVLSLAGSRQLRGCGPITDFTAETFSGENGYLADPCLVIQARDTALVVTARGANVQRRGPDGVWRYEILHLLTNRHKYCFDCIHTDQAGSFECDS